jgi:hypothetical protein
MTSPESAPLRIQDIVTQLRGIAEELKAIRKDQSLRERAAKLRRKKDRRQFLALCVSLFIDLALSVTLSVVAASQVSATQVVQSNQGQLQQAQVQIRNSQVDSCEAGNVYRLNSKQYQKFFLGILAAPIPGQKSTPASRAVVSRRLRQLNDEINRIFAPVDCIKRFPPVKPPTG